MFDTESVFSVLAADETQQRVASRQALALAHTRVNNHLGRFLRGAVTIEEFEARLAAVQDELLAYVAAASDEVGHEHPEHIAKALIEHYAQTRRWQPREAIIKEAPGKEHMKGVSPKRNRQYEHIKEQLIASGKSEEEAAEEAARTVNKQRAEHGEAKEGAGKQGSPLGPNPYDRPGDQFYDENGQPAPDPMRNPEGYIRPGVPVGVGGHDEGYEQIPYEVAPDPRTQRDYGQDEGLQIAPNLPPVHVPPHARRPQGSVHEQIIAASPPFELGPSQYIPVTEPEWGSDEQSAFDAGFNNDLCRNCGHPYDAHHPQTGLCPPVPNEREHRHVGSVDPSEQKDTSPGKVSCPECGGDGKTADGARCPKCGGSGKVDNFGDSLLDHVASVRTADGNTGLGEPEPKIDKRKWTPQNVGNPDPGSTQHPNRVKDIIEPIRAVNRSEDDHDLSEIGEQTTEHEDLPAASENNSGFSTKQVPAVPSSAGGTFGDGGQANPVTR